MWPLLLVLALLQAPGASAPAPSPAGLTEVERLLVENAVLQERLAQAIEDGDACRVALAPHRTAENRAIVTRAKAAAKARIEAAHPGYVLTEAGTLETRPTP